MVLAAGLSYAIYSLVTPAEADPLTVTELMAQGSSIHDQQTMVGGKVAPSSIDWNSESKTIKFIVTDDKESLSIILRAPSLAILTWC